MEKRKYRLKGYESFIIREGWLDKGLEALNADPEIFVRKKGAEVLGVGNNMANAIRYWLKTSGLMTEKGKEGACLTPTGKLVLAFDPYLESNFSLWLVHFGIVRNLEAATSFCLFFNQVRAEEFTKEELFFLLRRELTEYLQQEEFSEHSLKDDCIAILNMYAKTRLPESDPEDKKYSPFSALGLVKKNGVRYEKAQPDFLQLHPYVVFYLLQGIFQRQESISVDKLLNGWNMPGFLCNLGSAALNEYLDRLDYEELVRVDRTAGLNMVYRMSGLKEEEVIEQYYKTQVR